MSYGKKGGFKGKGKGKGKGVAPGARMGADDPVNAELLNHQVLDSLLPMVASIIDNNNGVLHVSKIAEKPEIVEQLKKIPKGYPKELATILAKWNDFFVQLDNGVIGTAMGYETGLIREDGTVDPSVEIPAAVAKETPAVDAYATSWEKLQAATDELYSVCLDMSHEDSKMFEAFNKVQMLRIEVQTDMNMNSWGRKGKGKGGKGPNMKGGKFGAGNSVSGAIHFSDHVRRQRREEILGHVIDILQKSPTMSAQLSNLVSNDRIRDAKKGVISKFKGWLEEYPSLFGIERVGDTPQYNVTLIGDPDAPGAKVAIKNPEAKKPAKRPRVDSFLSTK